MTTREEDARLCKVAVDWGCGVDQLDPQSFTPQEGLLHELCHAVTLGHPLRRDCSDRTSFAFDGLNGRSTLLGMTFEAFCFAVEKHAIRMLRWQKKARLRKVIEEVWENGFSGQPCSLKEFKGLIQLFYRQTSTRELAGEVTAKVLKLARPKKHRRYR